MGESMPLAATCDENRSGTNLEGNLHVKPDHDDKADMEAGAESGRKDLFTICGEILDKIIIVLLD